ncbi:hypothetical protein CCAX7_27750 [Capsulimonas corticalis]|uniref:Uncharacterized protein n=1 Tax=Capsulimonas corticalis TaxID=2219043 RepID=A0A402CTH5_9BACT|nr:hypothetical protein [Capsulimonas corticalis]BDI30724.1 hypothetical protein CCAX7_27750 [Capsulimonas corticalis]
MTLDVDRDDVILQGRWRRDGRDVRVDVNDAFDGDRADGDGKIVLRDSRKIDKINLRFTANGDRRVYTVDFSAD